MKNILTLLTLITFLTINCSIGQITKNPIKISDFKFETILGMNKNEPKNVYCLLGSGFFKTPRSNNSDSLIRIWLQKHPLSLVFSISSFGPLEINDKESRMIYCWIIEGQDTLNNYLIRNGCFPGGTMIRPQTWDELDKREKDLYNDLDEKPDVKVYVDKKTYDNFIEQIKNAEQFAKKNKLGIWLEEEEN